MNTDRSRVMDLEGDWGSVLGIRIDGRWLKNVLKFTFLGAPSGESRKDGAKCCWKVKRGTNHQILVH